MTNPCPIVVVPVYRTHASRLEQVSLAHLREFLGKYQISFIGPGWLSQYWPEHDFIEFPDEYFRSRYDYNRLLLSPLFYRRFAEYTHVLVYQLDALVFSDELLSWCAEPYDYIGATFYRDLIEQADGYRWRYSRVACCNGGLSLRRVEAFLAHLEGRRSLAAAVARRMSRLDFKGAALILRYRPYLNPSRPRHHESLNEDVYFGVFSPLIEPSLRLPPSEVSNKFAFENVPNEVFERAKRVMPFGCHAFYKSQATLDFWRPHLVVAARDLGLDSEHEV